MKPELLIFELLASAFGIWLVAKPEQAARFYARLYHRSHGPWGPRLLRIAGLVFMVFNLLIFSGILR
jgi:hypothetical protein